MGEGVSLVNRAAEKKLLLLARRWLEGSRSTVKVRIGTAVQFICEFSNEMMVCELYRAANEVQPSAVLFLPNTAVGQAL